MTESNPMNALAIQPLNPQILPADAEPRRLTRYCETQARRGCLGQASGRGVAMDRGAVVT